MEIYLSIISLSLGAVLGTGFLLFQELRRGRAEVQKKSEDLHALLAGVNLAHNDMVKNMAAMGDKLQAHDMLLNGKFTPKEVPWQRSKTV